MSQYVPLSLHARTHTHTELYVPLSLHTRSYIPEDVMGDSSDADKWAHGGTYFCSLHIVFGEQQAVKLLTLKNRTTRITQR